MPRKYKPAPTYRSRGDTRPLVLVIRDPDSLAVLDLTGATSAKFYLQDAQEWRGEDYDAPWSRYNQGSSSGGGLTLKVSAGTCSFLSPRTDGKVQYNPSASDTDTAGEYIMQVKVTLLDGTITTWPPADSDESRLEISPALASLA